MPDVLLRGIPEPLHGELRDAARRNRRSLNAEILARLESSVGARRVDVDQLLARVDERRARGKLPPLDDTTLRGLKEAGRA